MREGIEPQPNATGKAGNGPRLIQLRGIGPEFAGVLRAEAFFRSFSNGGQVAACAGVAPSPWQNGSIDREQGVSKAGDKRLRTTIIQVAWLYLRHQPDSELTTWYTERVSANGGRARRVIGRTKGGMNTKLHALADASGRPLSFFMTAGRFSDYTGAAALLGDRRYDADWSRDALQAASPVTSPSGASNAATGLAVGSKSCSAGSRIGAALPPARPLP